VHPPAEEMFPGGDFIDDLVCIHDLGLLSAVNPEHKGSDGRNGGFYNWNPPLLSIRFAEI